jgi:UDP:flavonoid glycosyltransferase YjiC (YdhE family)
MYNLLKSVMVVISDNETKFLAAHPSCRGFITHGGLLSTHEGICYGVPLIVLPVFGDQDQNSLRIVNMGCGLQLEITALTEEDIFGAISKLLGDNR